MYYAVYSFEGVHLLDKSSPCIPSSLFPLILAVLRTLMPKNSQTLVDKLEGLEMTLCLMQCREIWRLSSANEAGLYKYSSVCPTIDRLGPVTSLYSELTTQIMNPFKHFEGFLGRGIGRSQDPCLHRTAQHKKSRVYIHASTGFRTQYPGV